ncbi:MAG: LuxR C-terminal-related transcriptional regulator [Intrasporangium sp.]|uniref:helix-turn-helix transcriptional regulator n=1 Tax=Intrasporangium sp. TaxID=1925024 RepID=UPI002649E55B|nr:LuxR C-terminal-related transcriptional regulator [Intrasporangium sp.]MDN5798132.1 LuxR C-terminal-related transcriptional regulator [Intrasporangium sp.]
MPARATTGSLVVVVASPAAGPSLLATLEGGARLVDADQPLQTQLRKVDRALAGEPPVVDQSAELESVRRWMRESDLVASLTGREGQVLELLMCGWPAGEIAGRLVVSLPTVRTHIRSITRKLGVSSQLAAVALAYRSRSGVGRRLCRSHQF